MGRTTQILTNVRRNPSGEPRCQAIFAARRLLLHVADDSAAHTNGKHAFLDPRVMSFGKSDTNGTLGVTRWVFRVFVGPFASLVFLCGLVVLLLLLLLLRPPFACVLSSSGQLTSQSSLVAYRRSEVTAVFCQSAIDSAQSDHTMMVQSILDDKDISQSPPVHTSGGKT